MANAIDLGDDEGFVDISCCGVTQRCDLVSSFNKLLDHQKAHDGLPADEYNAKLVTDFAVPLGFPPMSHAQVNKLANAIADAVATVSKKNLTLAESPSSTASTPLS